MKVKEPLFEFINHEIDYQIKNGDCLNELKTVEDNKFDLILTSPLYYTVLK